MYHLACQLRGHPPRAEHRTGATIAMLSIVVPVYNEEGNIDPLYEAINSALRRIGDRYDWEFIFTDNCSTDNTFERLERLAARDPRVRVYRFTKNFGFQRSILTGYRLARGEAAIQIDCDLQDPPELIVDFVRLWEAGYQIVFGVRKSRPEAFYLRAMRHVFYRVISWLSSDYLPPDAGDFRLIDRCVLDLLHEYHDENPYLRGYIASLGYRQIGVAYDRAERRAGKSAFGMGSLITLALDGIVSHSIAPLRLASFVGFSLSIAAVLAIGVYLVRYQTNWPAGFATLAILMLISLAMNSVFLGIMGEYMARVYRQVKPGPLTIVDRFIDPLEPRESETEGRSARAASRIVLPKSEPKGGVPPKEACE
jgi:glycosyltransferase involved in cell wall biosynthesis